jgi:hypothetical protein
MPTVNSTGNHNKECVMANGRKCTLHSTQPGMPKTMSVACWYCGEWRCANHCRCVRESIPNGRKPRRYSSAAVAVAAPKAKAKAKAKAAAQEAVRPRQRARVEVEAEVLRAVGRPSLPSCELVDLSQWWSKLVAEVAGFKIRLLDLLPRATVQYSSYITYTMPRHYQATLILKPGGG